MFTEKAPHTGSRSRASYLDRELKELCFDVVYARWQKDSSERVHTGYAAQGSAESGDPPNRAVRVRTSGAPG